MIANPADGPAAYTTNYAAGTELRVVASKSGATSGDIVLVADTGAIITTAGSNTDAWTYQTPGEIVDVSPNVGQLNTQVEITGTRLLSDGTSLTSVTLAGVEVKTLQSGYSAESVSIVVDQADAATGDVTLLANTGGRITLEDGWTYKAQGTILSVSPSSGQEGTEVSIYGVALRAHGSVVATVTLAGTGATIGEQNDLFVTVTVVEAAAATGDVILTADTGATVTKEDGWEYIEPPSISAVTPAAGQVGSIVVIDGTNLLAGADKISQVLLGGAAAGIEAESNTQITIKVYPGKTVGVGDVHIITDTGAFVLLADGFEYLDPGDINAITPSSGQYKTEVSITGSGLLGGGAEITSLTLAGIPVEDLVSATDDEIKVIVAAANEHTGDVVIVADTGAVVSRLDGWKYLELGEVTSVEPNVGQVGTSVVVSGARLTSGGTKVSQVILAGTDATITSYAPDGTSVNVVVARADQSNAGDVVLYAETGAEITASDAFSYLAEGEVTSVDPNNGQGGTYVTISGERLRGGGSEVSTVTLANVDAEIKSESDDVVLVRAAIGAAGEGHIVLTSESGAIVTLENGWTYNDAGAINTVAPATAQINTVVTIEGTTLLGGGDGLTWAKLAGVAAEVRSATDEKVVLVAAQPPSDHDYSVTDIVFLSKSGAVVQVSGKFSYVTEGAVVSLSPAVGQLGTKVTISGSSLNGAGNTVVTVTLNGVEATIESQTSTEVVVTTASSDVAGIGDVVLTADTEATVTSSGTWTYAPVGVVNAVEPASGQHDTRVEITGERLRGAGGAVVSVSLAGTEVQELVSESETAVRVVVADADAGSFFPSEELGLFLGGDGSGSGNRGRRFKVCLKVCLNVFVAVG